MVVSEFLQRLPHGFHRNADGFIALCPAHDDRLPSLSIKEGREGKIVLHCHAGCKTESVVAGLGLQMADLFPDSKARSNGAGAASHGQITATYDYTDEGGKLLFQVVRYEPKDFKQRRPDGRGDWVWHLKCSPKCECKAKLPPVRRVLFNLPEVAKAKSVITCEGEKDCLTAKKLGLAATCNPHGAGKWRPEYSESLRGKRVVVICDADAPGVAHGRDVARSLIGMAACVKLIEALPQSKDLTEWVAKGGIRDALLELIKETRELTAADVAKWQPANANGFTLTPLGELLAKPDAPVDYLVENILVAGTPSAMVSKPKVGKSTLARNLCLAVSRGDDFLGLRTKQGECVYVALEERGEDVRNDFRSMGADGSEPILIHAAAAPAEGVRALCELVKERKPRLVVIDPLFRLAHVQNENAYAEVYSALGPLIDASRETGTHVMALHHSGKGIGKPDPIDSPLGSTAIGGAVSTLIILRRTESYRTVETVQRIGQAMPETVLAFDPETKRLSLGGTRDEAEAQTVSGEILEFLRAADEPKTEPEITEAVEGKTKFVRRALGKLVEEGKVSRAGAGKRGDPYRYRFSFSCSQYIAGTREQETEKQPQTRINTERNLVPTSEQKPILVPANGGGQKSAVSTTPNGPDGLPLTDDAEAV